jgi:hypothetical protein
MNFVCRATVALVLTTAAWPTFAADYFWNCTTPDGIKYADASKCDKGDAAVKMMKGDNAKPGLSVVAQPAQPADAMSEKVDVGVCPEDPGYCSQPNFGIAEGAPRAQAIAQFMRKRACEFKQRFPARCAKSH